MGKDLRDGRSYQQTVFGLEDTAEDTKWRLFPKGDMQSTRGETWKLAGLQSDWGG